MFISFVSFSLKAHIDEKKKKKSWKSNSKNGGTYVHSYIHKNAEFKW